MTIWACFAVANHFTLRTSRRKKFGGMGRPQLSEMRALQKENKRLKKIVADLQLDKLILKESLDQVKPKA